MQVKARLVTKIGEIIKQRHLTQQQAAEILGMTQPKLSGMLRGPFRGISEAKMLDCLNRLGRDVEIVVRKASRSQTGADEGCVCVDVVRLRWMATPTWSSDQKSGCNADSSTNSRAQKSKRCIA